MYYGLGQESISKEELLKVYKISSHQFYKGVNKLVKYLTSDDDNELQLLAKFIETTNNNRKETTDTFFKKLDKNNYLKCRPLRGEKKEALEKLLNIKN